MPRRTGLALAAMLTAASAALHACHTRPAPFADGGEDAPAADDGAGTDRPASVLAVDFTVSGCPVLDLSIPDCTGRAPLTVTFIPINPEGITRYLWDFGDGTPKSSDTSPTHVYGIRGTDQVSAYEITLVGAGASGTVAKSRDSFIIVTRNPLGGPCEQDNQCADTLSCVCKKGASCPSAFAHGICAASCRDKACAGTAVCADLTLGAAQPEPWQQPLCLQPCNDDEACQGGLRCRELPSRASAGAWVKGCFAPEPADVGESCRGANGQLRSDQCITGTCADLGANGLCSFDCTTHPCPGDTVCAKINNGQNLCLRPCTAAFTCSDDPLLACVGEDTTGPLGFTLPAATPAGGIYCAPRRCTDNTDCGPSGACTAARGGSNCVRR